MKFILNILKNVGTNIFKDDCMGNAAEMAFNLILSLFPFFILLTALFGLIGSESFVNQIVDSLSTVAPKSALTLLDSVLKGVIKSSSSGGLFTLGLLGTVWVSSNAVVTIMKALNKAYNIDDKRNFWRRRFISIIVVFLFALVILTSVNLIIFGKTILFIIYKYFYMPEVLLNTVLLIRWPITFFSLFAMALILYYFLPYMATNKRTRLFTSIPGALFFCFFWLFISWAFSLYVENFSKFNAIYGALGAVIVLLVWLYYTSLIILIGGEINSEFYKELYLEEPELELPCKKYTSINCKNAQ